MGDWTDDLPDDWPDEGPDTGLEGLAGGHAGSDDHAMLDPDGLAGLGDHADDPSVGEQVEPWDLDELEEPEELDDGGHADLLGLFDGLGDPDASGDEHTDPFELAVVVANGDDGDLGDDQEGLTAPLDQVGLAQQAGGVEPPMLADAWVDALGRGAVDPAGTHDSVLGLLGWDGDDRSDRNDDTHDDTLLSGPSSWLDSRQADPDGWLHDALLVGDDESALGSDGHPTGGAEPGAATAAIDDLWDRLAPGEALPTDSAGGTDHAGALDLLAERAGSAALLDVVAAARRLVDP